MHAYMMGNIGPHECIMTVCILNASMHDKLYWSKCVQACKIGNSGPNACVHDGSYLSKCMNDDSKCMHDCSYLCKCMHTCLMVNISLNTSMRAI